MISKSQFFSILCASGAVCGITTYILYTKYMNNQNKSHSSAVTTKEAAHDHLSQDENLPGKAIILGLDNSGKSALVAALCGNKPTRDFLPTKGFNVLSTSQLTDGVVELWEIGGDSKTRKYWHNFLSEKQLVVFVVDSGAKTRFREAREAFSSVLRDESVASLPIIVVANKQDNPLASSETDVSNALNLDRCPPGLDINIVSTAVPLSGAHEGVEDLREMIIEVLSHS